MSEQTDFRALLIEAGRNAGAYIDDRVSDNFLKIVPEEVRLKVASLANRDAPLVARAFAVIERMAKWDGSCAIPGDMREVQSIAAALATPARSEARAIVAALEPVDLILLEARQVVAGLYEGQGVAHLREQALSGEGDEWFHTKVARAALTRGRQLQRDAERVRGEG